GGCARTCSPRAYGSASGPGASRARRTSGRGPAVRGPQFAGSGEGCPVPGVVRWPGGCVRLPVGERRDGREGVGSAAGSGRRLSDDEYSVLLAELLLRHPELAAGGEEITSTLLVVENEQELGDEITAKLRALRANGPVSGHYLP